MAILHRSGRQMRPSCSSFLSATLVEKSPNPTLVIFIGNSSTFGCSSFYSLLDIWKLNRTSSVSEWGLLTVTFGVSFQLLLLNCSTDILQLIQAQEATWTLGAKWKLEQGGNLRKSPRSRGDDYTTQDLLLRANPVESHWNVPPLLDNSSIVH